MSINERLLSVLNSLLPKVSLVAVSKPKALTKLDKLMRKARLLEKIKFKNW